MFKDKKSFVIRFLKENELLNNKTINKVLKSYNNNYNKLPISFIDNGIGWHSSSEGHSFWLKKQCEYIKFILKYDENFSFYDKETVLRYFYKLISEGYFSNSSLSRSSDFYIEFENLYKKYDKKYC